MPISLNAYRDIAPPGRVELLYRLSRQTAGKRMLHITGNRTGGEIGEILHTLIPLLTEVGLDVRWETMKGAGSFHEAVQTFRNGLQGDDVKVPESLLEGYRDVINQTGRLLDLTADSVITHDPHTLGLIDYAPSDSRWIWRCYLDVSRPQRKTWAFLRPYVIKYDAAVFSLPQFAQPLPVPQFLVYPSIDPFSEKNRELEPEEIAATLDTLHIPRDKPILLQVSRFTRSKDLRSEERR